MSTHTHGNNYLNCDKTLGSWIVTLDHKRIGLMYLFSVCLFMAIGGLMAMLIRLELMRPGPDISTADEYNQFFTLHGIIMVFLVIIPAVPAALGNFFLPIMLGAKDVAFPRINLLSFYVYLGGAIWTVANVLLHGIDTGWTFYTPYSTSTQTGVAAVAVGAFVLGFSSILTGLNFVVTVHVLRAKGQGWMRLPLFVWALYGTALVQILATPVLAITLLLLAMERIYGVGIFDPKLGGDPVLFQHFFWFYSHPAVYIMILPGMGVVSEIIPVFSRKPIFGYRAMVFSIMGIAFIGFFVWGHHLYTSTQSNYVSLTFSAITFLVAVPTGVKMFGWIATLYRGSIQLASPMLYAISFLFLFLLGGLTGVWLASAPLDLHMHDTYFVVGHFHYTMAGGAITAFLGGLHYWWPKMTGKMFNEPIARICAVIFTIGYVGTFFPQLVMGLQGMPRRYFDYPPQYEVYHKASSMMAFMMGTTLVIMLINFMLSLLSSKKAPENPWGSKSLEWQTATPPVHHNFEVEPEVTCDPYDYGRPLPGGHT